MEGMQFIVNGKDQSGQMNKQAQNYEWTNAEWTTWEQQMKNNLIMYKSSVEKISYLKFEILRMFNLILIFLSNSA